MIKRIRLARRRADVPRQSFERDWRRAVDELTDRAGTDAVAVGFTTGDGDDTYDAVSFAWYADDGDLRRAPGDEELPTATDVDVLVADEEIVRGADWLAARVPGEETFAHMALTPRASGLGRDEFVHRWRDHARGSTNPIPESVRGHAYVQNHPRGDAPIYDAVNEAHFDDLDDLRRRVAWFQAHGVGRRPDDLFDVATFLVVRLERLHGT